MSAQHSDEDHVQELIDDESERKQLAARGTRRTQRIDPALGESIARRMAAASVRRLCREHECTEPMTGHCDDPMHRQKADYTREMLEMLSLDGERQPYTEKEKQIWLAWLGQAGPPENVEGLGLDDAA